MLNSLYLVSLIFRCIRIPFVFSIALSSLLFPSCSHGFQLAVERMLFIYLNMASVGIFVEIGKQLILER